MLSRPTNRTVIRVGVIDLPGCLNDPFNTGMLQTIGNMSYDDQAKAILNQKIGNTTATSSRKRSRVNMNAVDGSTVNDNDNVVSDGEYTEKVDDTYHNNSSSSTSHPNMKRQRYTAIYNDNTMKQTQMIQKSSREELELERQRRMAALRGENEYDDNDNYNGNDNNTQRQHSNQQQQHQSMNRKVINGKESIIHVNFDEIRNTTKQHKVDYTNQRSNETTKNDDDDDDEDEDDDDDDQEQQLMKELFGISDFGTTKNTKVDTNHTTAAMGIVSKKNLKGRKYRQYMNRKNGFNRPLDNV
jgi:hypothetical protein